MAEVTRHRQGEMIRTVLEVLSPNADGLPAREVIRLVEIELPPSEYESQEYPSTYGGRRYDKIIRFATIPMTKAGWLVKSKGTWIATADGIRAVDTFSDPAELMRESVRIYREWRKAQTNDSISLDDDVPGEEPESTVTLEEAEETAHQDILDFLSRMPPYDFQDLVAGLLEGLGYHVGWVSPPGPDRGLDIVAHTDPLGVNGPRMKIQVKRRSDKIAVDEVRSFTAVLGNTDVGVFVATGGFTSDASAFARHDQTKRLTLIDAPALVELWIQNYDNLSESARQRLPLRPIYFLDIK